MYGILGENDSDVATLKVLIRRLARDESLSIKGKGYGGASEMLRKGAQQLKLFRSLRCNRFIVCHDADGPDPEPNRALVQARIVKPAKLDEECCIVVPVEEVEAWILADIECAVHVFPSWRPAAIRNPEAIRSPKEFLEHLSNDGKSRPRYSHATHNEKIAKYLDLEAVKRKCPAFCVLADFVRG